MPFYCQGTVYKNGESVKCGEVYKGTGGVFVATRDPVRYFCSTCRPSKSRQTHTNEGTCGSFCFNCDRYRNTEEVSGSEYSELNSEADTYNLPEKDNKTLELYSSEELARATLQVCNVCGEVVAPTKYINNWEEAKPVPPRLFSGPSTAPIIRV